MVNTLAKSLATPATKATISLCNEADPIQLRGNYSSSEAELVIRGIYRQVLGNAHVMESERLTDLESQLKGGTLTVREFVRHLAKSELYRTRFFDSCYRYRAIELNFKHLLGRAPDSYEEMYYHSNILDEKGFEADIDTYLDSEEYQTIFGEYTVPYYRGYQTSPGQSMVGFANMIQLLRSVSGSDKNLVASSQPCLSRSLLKRDPYRQSRATDMNNLVETVLKPQAESSSVYSASRLFGDASGLTLQQTIQKQAQEINRLQQQLADLHPFATIGSSISSSTWQPSSISASDKATTSASLQEQADAQAAQINSLREKVADAQCFATIGEAHLNKWRSRTFSR